jgi:arylsulfatase A-like enzyme
MTVHRWITCLMAATGLLTVAKSGTIEAQQRPPNFIFIFLDDSGYADSSVYGAKEWKTPNIDRLAREGVRFTNFHVPQAICSASRVALLTGSYPTRVGINGALPSTSRVGISDSEHLLPEVLKTRGYTTAIFGKWHLGAAPPFLPIRHGFDEYFGIPYSNDMVPAILVENDKFLRAASQDDRDNLTTMITERAVSFIERNRSRPFFLYVPHHMPHVPLAVSSKFKGKTSRLYGDVMLELDWSVGQIVDAVARAGLAKDTMIMFSSDNGPWLIYGDHAGSAGPLREGKQTSFEGGVREPFIARWPGHIRAGRVVETRVMSFDIFPTLVKLARADLPADHPIDGRDIWPWISGQRTTGEPHEVLYFYSINGAALQAVESGPWKLTLPHQTFHAIGGRGGVRGTQEPIEMPLSLFDLRHDIGETTNVAGERPDVVQKLMGYAEQARDDLGDSLTNRTGKNVRKPAQLPEGVSPLPDGAPVPAPPAGRGGASR